MTQSDRNDLLRAIPPLDSLLADPLIEPLRRLHPRFPWTRFLRILTEEFREACENKPGWGKTDRESVRRHILETAIRRLASLRHGGQRRVINGTGVLLHTNLGRAVQGPAVRAAVATAMARYVNLEFDLATGERSRRGLLMNELAAIATGAEAAMVVNNNAAAVYLAVNTCSPPGRVLVSRGELVEIGGSFRLPDILSRAAGEVVEVGTTNRTYARDYEAVAKPGDLILKVHQSNYQLKGFIHQASIDELVEVGRLKKCDVMFDLGSGALYDYALAGIEGEGLASSAIEAGVDCVTMSGDKLLGGVQAGIILGREIFLARLRTNPLRRALRVDKITIAGLEALLQSYLFDPALETEVVVLGQVHESVEALQARAEKVAKELMTRGLDSVKFEVVPDEAAVGGGSFACEKVASAALAIRCSSEKKAVALAGKMRTHALPIIPRIKGAEVRINMRTVLPDEDGDLEENLFVILTDFN